MKPPEVAAIHRSICERAKCEYLDKIDCTDPCASCPNGHWGRYQARCADNRPATVGLGDVVEKLAKPIAKALKLPCLDDKGALRPESGCAKRRAKLNELGSRVTRIIGVNPNR